MSLNDISTIVVTSAGAGVTRAGYGVLLIPSHTAPWAERQRTYSSLSGVAADWATNTPEYMAARAAFSQSPRMRQVVIGRAALKPTPAWTVGVVTPALLSDYKLRVGVATGTVFTSQDANYNTAGATAWSPSGLWSRGDLIANDHSVGAQYLYSCLGPSGAGMDAGFTGYGGASGPIGITGTYRDNGIYWAWVGTGGTGAVTSDAIALGLKARIEALGSPTAVGTGANQLIAAISGGALSRQLTLTANAPAKFFGLQVYSRAALTLAQDHADPGIATDLDAIKLSYNSWYGLVTLYNSKALVLAAAAWVEANTKLYAAATQDTAAATATENDSATDVAHGIKAAAYARTWAFHHPSNDQFADAAEIGKFFPYDPGSETWRMKTLAGVTVEAYSDTETTNLKAKFAHYYYDIGGRGVVGGDAKTGSGEYIDTVRFLDWYASELQGDLADLAIAVPKIPFTNPGIDQVAGKVRARNKAGIKRGGIAAYPEPVVTVPDVTEVDTADKTARELAGVTTEWTLAGAIHHITVSVTANV